MALVNISNYGVVSGTGTDQTAAINAAIAQAALDGHDLIFDAGDYLISGDITLEDGVSLFGSSTGTTRIYSDSANEAATFTNGGFSGNTINSLTISGFDFDNVNLNLDGNTVAATITDNIFYNTNSQIQFRGINGDFEISDNIFLRTEPYDDGSGIETSRSESIKLFDADGTNISGNILGGLNANAIDTAIYDAGLQARVAAFTSANPTIDVFNAGFFTSSIQGNDLENITITENILIGDDGNHYLRDHVVYFGDYENLTFAGNYVAGYYNDATGGAKFRNADNTFIFNNFFDQISLLTYSYDNLLPHHLDNTFVFNNTFVLENNEGIPGVKNAIYYIETSEGFDDGDSGTTTLLTLTDYYIYGNTFDVVSNNFGEFEFEDIFFGPEVLDGEVVGTQVHLQDNIDRLERNVSAESTVENIYSQSIDPAIIAMLDALIATVPVAEVVGRPTFDNLDAIIDYTEGDGVVLIDSDASISDADFDALNGGDGNYSGAELTVSRSIVSNTSAATNIVDILSLGTLTNVTFANGELSVLGNVIATVDQSNNSIVITFTDANGAVPTTALVNEILQAVTYENIDQTVPIGTTTQAAFTYRLNDGNSNGYGVAGINLISTDSDDLFAGTDGDDIIDAGIGDDTVNAGLGNDSVDGGSGNDVLRGNEGNDTLNGESGNDTLFGATGADDLLGGSGDDFLNGGDGEDTLNGGAGNDDLRGEAGDDELSGGDDNDAIKGGDGDDFIDGGDGDDTLEGDAGVDLLQGGQGADNIRGGLGNDTLRGDEDNDTLRGEEGDDMIFGDAGDDFIEGGDGIDSISGGIGIDDIRGDAGNDQLNGGDGNDSIKGGDDDDNIFGENGNDSLEGNDGNDTIIGGLGLDDIRGGLGNDSIEGNEDNDILRGEAGDDVILGGDGDDFIEGGDGIDAILGGEGIDDLRGDAGNDFIQGGDGDDSIKGGDDNDLIFGEGGDDALEGNAGDDIIFGGVGEDNIRGGTGDDQIDGGEANDTLRGEDGIDIIFGEAGDDFIEGGSDADTIFGGDGQDDLRGDGGNDVIYTGLGGNNGSDAVFAGDGDDIVVGNTDGGDLRGQAGDDILFGGAGIDSIRGGTGNDRLSGDDGNDALRGEDGDDAIDGGLGDDFIEGGNGADRIDGGQGVDFIRLQGGVDTIVFTANPGNDIIADFDPLTEMIDISAFSAADQATIMSSVAGAGSGLIHTQLTFPDGSVVRFNNTSSADFTASIFITVPTNSGPVAFDDAFDVNTVTGSVSGNLFADNGSGADSDADGDTFVVSEIDGFFFGPSAPDELVVGIDGSLNGFLDSDATGSVSFDGSFTYNLGDAHTDLAFGDTATETLDYEIHDGNGGRDEATITVNVRGGSGTETSGADSITGTANNDTINSIAGVDLIFGLVGDDTINAGSQNDTVHGGDGNDILFGEHGNDSLFGNEGNDSIFGGIGNDSLRGEGGDDILTGNEGNDFIAGGDGIDTLEGNEGNDRLFGGEGNDSLRGGDGDDYLVGDAGDDFIAGADGNDNIHGRDGDDRAFGGEGNDTLRGFEGNDYLVGDNGNDLLVGNEGNDNLQGRAGADRIFGGDGNDSIKGGTGNDYIVGDAGGDLLLGEDGNDRMFGRDGNDRLFGGEGNDYLAGGTGNDTLSGDGGFDTLVGEAGADTFVFTGNWRRDKVADFENGIDMLDLSSHGLSGFSDLTIIQDGTTVIISITGDTHNDIRLENTDISEVDAADFFF